VPLAVVVPVLAWVLHVAIRVLRPRPAGKPTDEPGVLHTSPVDTTSSSSGAPAVVTLPLSRRARG
jgi:hypothetical protein